MDEISEVTEEQMKQAMQAVLEVARIYNDTFKTEAGMKVLEHMTNMTTTSTLTGNDMMDAQASVSPSEFMFMREGHGQVVRFIKRMINYYKENN